MKSICFIELLTLQLFCRRIFAVLVISLAFSFISFSQIQDIEVNSTIQTGIIQTIDQNNELGIIQMKVVGMDFEMAQQIRFEFVKYQGEIIGYGYSVLDNLIIVSYNSPIYPNFLQAILDRVNIDAFYSQNGQDVYYQKDGYSAFIR